MGLKAYAVIRSSGFCNVTDGVQILPDDKETLFYALREDDGHRRICIELDLPEGCFIERTKHGELAVFGPNGYRLDGWCNMQWTRLCVYDGAYEILSMKMKA